MRAILSYTAARTDNVLMRLVLKFMICVITKVSYLAVPHTYPTMHQLICICIHIYTHIHMQYIIDLRPFKEHGIVEEDVAKRLQVYTITLLYYTQASYKIHYAVHRIMHSNVCIYMLL